MLKSLLLSILFLIGFSSFAYAFDEDLEARVEQQAKEIQNLLNRIEILEHKVNIYKQQDDIKVEEIKTLPIDKINYNTSTKISQDEEDIFDLVNQEPQSPQNIVKKDKIITKNEVARDKKDYDFALATLRENKFKKAEELFAEFIKNNSNSKLLGNAYFWYGESFFKRKIFDKAAVNYLKAYQKFPKGEKAADSLLKLSSALGELNKKADACKILNKLETEFPSRSSASIKTAKDNKIKFGCKN